MPTDTEEIFKKNLKNPLWSKYFSQQSWIDFTYKINSLGFRGEEFTDQKSLVVLGCSHTMGIGLPNELVWPALVGKQLNLPVINLAWGGDAADTCFRLAEYWLPKLNPALVIMLTPPQPRVEVLRMNGRVGQVGQPCRSSGVITWLPMKIIPSLKNLDDYITNWMLNDENSRLNRVKNERAIKNICDELSVKCMIYQSDTDLQPTAEISWARDTTHYGPLPHKNLAEKILNDIATK
jgi:hypothetical protein